MIKTIEDKVIGLLRVVVEDQDELNKIEFLLKDYFEALGPPTDKDVKDSKALNSIKHELFTYEKKYVPLIKENFEVAQRVNPDNLIMTVGFQPEPIILSILCLKPKNVFLLHTEESLNQVSAVKQDEDIINLGTKITCYKITEYEANENYKAMKELIGKVSGNTVVDPTGGRKMMIASVTLAAFYYKLPMVYMHSEELKRQVTPFSDRIRAIDNPLSTFGDTDLSLVETLFNSHMYEAAVKVSKNLLDSIKDIELAKKYELLNKILTVYRDWDAFKHSDPKAEPTLSKELEDVVNEMKKFGLEEWLPKNVENNCQFLKGVESKYKKDSFNMIDEYRLVDIYLSALRRGSEKQSKYDDAIARLYRCIDMCATYTLKTSYNLDSTEYPDYKKIATKVGKPVEKIKKEFFEKYKFELPQQMLGLDIQMKLLSLLDSNSLLPKIYSGMEDYMKMRNRSILAHGTKPLDEHEWGLLRDRTLLMIKATIGDKKFEEIYGMAFHGKISLRP